MKNLLAVLSLLTVCSASSQSPAPLVVHEWGTFTSRYSDLGVPYQDLHRQIDEPVPPFVHYLNFDQKLQFYLDRTGKADYSLCNLPVILRGVTIKMETPVLYFYSAQEVKDLQVKVSFPDGSISEFYPMPYKKEDTAYLRSKVKIENNDFGESPFLNFAGYGGFAHWKVNVLAPEKTYNLTQPDNTVPNLWLAPRKTQANLVECNGEIEKYIFYRGLAGFQNPIVPIYTKTGNLLLENNSGAAIPYAIVYEKSSNGDVYIWGVNPLKKGGSNIFYKNRVAVNASEWKNYRKGFVKALTEAGLYEDEAEAMLNTWEQSYFGKPGLRVFWIVPRAFTDGILPISFSKEVSDLQRVMIGRTEIDEYNSFNLSKYKEDPVSGGNIASFTVYPNPSSSGLYIKSDMNSVRQVEVTIIDFSGKPVYSSALDILPHCDNQVPCDLPAGLYYVLVDKGGETEKTVLLVK